MALNKEWTKIVDHSNIEYIKGVDQFLSFALLGVSEEEKDTFSLRCPCDSCRNVLLKPQCEVRADLFKFGMYDKYTIWDLHGEIAQPGGRTCLHTDCHEFLPTDDENVFNMLLDAYGISDDNHEVSTIENGHRLPQAPTGKAKKFFSLLKQYKECISVDGKSKMSKLSYILKLMHLKVLHNWTDASFDSLLKLQSEVLGTKLHDSYYEAKKLITQLGLECIKIDACVNDCILYWRENSTLSRCPTCDSPRWKGSTDSLKGTKVPFKVLRYFPLKSRLQRLFMSRKTAKHMRWHKDERVDDDIMRHPADSFAWKEFDKEYIPFSEDSRNVRLGLACDGFQPFDNTPHTVCPVVLIPYNLPPWMCMKPHSFMLTLLIPGPTGPGRNIDVYLQPLIEELKELWVEGVETYDAHAKENFRLHAAVLWTINDFPAYADLSGWSTKGGFACPNCHKETKRTSLRAKGGYLHHRRWIRIGHKWRKDAKSFNNKVEKGRAPVPLSSDEVLQQHSKFTQEKFGTLSGKKRKWTAANSLYGWRKKSIFFQLPYWRKLKLRHNLDVMHIEKNVSDNILSTLMSIKGKTKDTLNARVHLVTMDIRRELSP